MSEYIVTGRTGQNHVTSADHGAMNASFAGSGRYVADGIGDSLSAEVVTNNLVRIHSGEVFNQGRHMRVEANTYVDCTIENGSQSKLRYDLIVFRYTKNADTGVENGEIVVIKGTAGTSATDPSYTTGNILAGALQDDMPLYRVKIDGINIVGLDKLFSTVPGLAALNAKVSQLNSDLVGLQTKTRINYLRPTLQAQIKNGVTITNNGDGTITLNGTATSDTSVNVGTVNGIKNYRIVGNPENENCTLFVSRADTGQVIGADEGLGCNLSFVLNVPCTINIWFGKGKVFNNSIFKPMITDNLSATYDDFVSFDESLVTGINSGLKIDLLWENASPRSVFAEQNLFVDLSNYKAVIIEACEYGAVDHRSDIKFNGFSLKGSGGTVATYYSDEHSYYSLSFVRRFYATDDRIWISNSSNNNTFNNSGAIPQRIWGLR